MKRLFVVFTLTAFLTKSLTMHPMQEPKTEVSTLKQEAERVKSSLDEQKEKLREQIETQSKKVENAPEEERQQEQDTLDKMQESATKISHDATTLEQFINNQNVTEEDAQKANADLEKSSNDIKEAQKLLEQLQSEFVEQKTETEEQIKEEAQRRQQEIEKLSSWQKFKIIVQKITTEISLAVKEFFGAQESVIGARNDLINIYDTLKDYTSKAYNAGVLADFYMKLGQFGNAMEAQQIQLFAAEQAYKAGSYSDADLYNIIKNNLINTLALKDLIEKNQALMTSEDQKTIISLEEKMNNLLGNIGYVINNESYYDILGLTPNATNKEITTTWKNLIKQWHPDKFEYGSAENIFAKNKTVQINKAYTTLSDTVLKARYDKEPIVQQGFEIRKMTPEELEAFKNKKVQQETNILGGM